MVEVRWEKITPGIAEVILDRNTHNRSIRDQRVSAFARDIRDGRWSEDNGETIKVSWEYGATPGPDDILVDGQHRLWAIIEAGVPINQLVAFGVPPAAQDTVDTGARRLYSDVLQLRGETHSVALAALVKRVNAWETTDQTPDRKNPTVTVPQLDATLESHPELREIVSSSLRLYDTSGKLAPCSMIGLVMWLTSILPDDEAKDDAQHFFDRLADGQNLAEGDPIYTLRKKLLENQQSQMRLTDRVMLAFLIKSWNAFRDGEELKILRYRPGGANPERFPTPR